MAGPDTTVPAAEVEAFVADLFAAAGFHRHALWLASKGRSVLVHPRRQKSHRWLCLRSYEMIWSSI
jgi:hypothetical protein